MIGIGKSTWDGKCELYRDARLVGRRVPRCIQKESHMTEDRVNTGPAEALSRAYQETRCQTGNAYT
ncbi:hypothetical protein QJS10_CPB04g00439 [Acorus calamus]|uniref:Uncharacterized protein n=1 Tax=Acorus calamus TaxID=4465 RepID=A0AAV9F2D8_ACOCL|nr:hypothetical protein QJS10_CPB04g00439 [Acorus calamus]